MSESQPQNTDPNEPNVAKSDTTQNVPSGDTSGETVATSANAPGDSLRRRMKILDGVLLVLVLALAFLVAFFPIGNSDFFLHLASGRLVTNGEFTFSNDPFVYGERAWVNHSWLFDLGLYSLYQMQPYGTDLMQILKALAVVGIVLVMLRASRVPGQRMWVPKVCAALAVLAISTRILVQPVVLSYLFVALTLWLLVRMTSHSVKPREGGEQTTAPVAWMLLPLFALWANCDQWFFLGPVLVALWLLGAVVQESVGPKEEDARSAIPRLGLLLILGTAATLLNPNLVSVWAIPQQLGITATSQEVENVAAYRSLFLSPFDARFFNSYLGLNAAGLAYFPLLVIGILSFVLNQKRLNWSWLFAWLGFAALSAYHARAIPFFAIVGGVLASRNCLEWSKVNMPDTASIKGQLRGWVISGRVLTCLLLLIAVVVAIPGWLHATPYFAFRVGLGLRQDPALERTTKQMAEVAQWHSQNFPDQPMRFFNTSPEVGHYMAWFNPEAHSFIDRRLNVSDKQARAFRETYVALGATAAPNELEEPRWRTVFRDWNIQYVFFYQRDLFARVPILNRLLSNPEEWVPLYQDGSACIFAWRDPKNREQPNPYKQIEWDRVAMAFGEDAMHAPLTRPATDPLIREWWMEAWRPTKPRPWQAQQARQYSLQFFSQSHHWQQRVQTAWFSLLLSRILAEASGANSFVDAPALALRTAISCSTLPTGTQPRSRAEQHLQSVSANWREAFLQSQDDSESVASLYLALRSARQALHVDPDDARTHLALGQIYFSLTNSTREKARVSNLFAFGRLRTYQTIAALQQAVELNPNLEPAHGLLAGIYADLGYLDLALHHFVEQFRCSKEIGPQPDESVEAFGKRLETMSAQLKSLEAEVNRRQDRFVIRTERTPPLEKAFMAMETEGQQPFGLAESAYETLSQLQSEELIVTQAGVRRAPGAEMLLKLYLIKGRIRDLRANLLPSWEKPLGVHRQLGWPNYQWFHLALAAASGGLHRGAETPR